MELILTLAELTAAFVAATIADLLAASMSTPAGIVYLPSEIPAAASMVFTSLALTSVSGWHQGAYLARRSKTCMAGLVVESGEIFDTPSSVNGGAEPMSVLLTVVSMSEL